MTHTLLECPEWALMRENMEAIVGSSPLTEESIFSILVSSNGKWNEITTIVGRIMVAKESAERARQDVRPRGRARTRPRST